MNPFDAETRSLYARLPHADRRTSLKALFERVPESVEVLDVGLGDGSLGEQLVRARNCTVDGVTLSVDEAERSRAVYRRIEIADLNEVPLHRLFESRRYTAIVCADVLEHVLRPTAVLDECRRLLAGNGRLLLSIPNVGYSGLIAELLAGEFHYRAEGLLDRTHVRFFTRRSLLRLLHDQGWQVEFVEPIMLDIRDSEFRPGFDLLPSAVRRYLLALPDGLTYQFIVQARLGNDSASTVEATVVETEPPPAACFSMQLYLKDASGYAEDRKLLAAARIGEQRQQVRFEFPATGGNLTGLRFDPADRPGFLHLFALRLLDAHGRPLWTWDGAVDSLQIGDPHEVVFRTPWTAQQGAVLLLCGDDPHFELPVDATQLGACSAGATLEVDLAWPMSADYLLFVGQVTADRARAQALASELSQAQAARQDASDELSRRAIELATVHAQLERQLAQNKEVTEQLAAQKAEVGRLASERQRLIGDCDARDAKLRRAAEEIASLTYAHSSSEAAKDAAVRQRDAARTRASEIEASRWFRLGRWVARRLRRTGSPLLRGAVSRAPAEPLAAIQSQRAGISIVVPVYKGLAETKACIESVLSSSSKAKLRFVLINDASPEPGISDYLREVAARDARVELVEHAMNLGFVASVNKGMKHSSDDDIILLNSDTEVAGDWVDRLREAAYREQGIATVTPFSNAATICGYPRFCVDGPMPTDMSTAALDRYFATENAGQLIDIPTAVGFCMFVRRDCLDEVGLFDADRFGRGYGEENDFCMRAKAKGWRHVLAVDTFVQHSGGVSFGEEKPARLNEAQELLAKLHPDYQQSIARHLQEDPAGTARLKVDVARVRASGLPSVLFISHLYGGGTERHLHELASALVAKANVFVLRPIGGKAFALRWLRAGEGFELCFLLPDQSEAFLEALRALGVAHVHYHHTRGHSARVFELAESLGLTHDFTAHDFYCVCPQVTLSDEIGRYCGEFGVEQCAGCLARRPAPDAKSIEAWRGDFRRLLERARYVFAPSDDAAARLNRYFPAIQVQSVPHPDLDAPRLAPQPEAIGGGRPLRIVVIGALSQIKGADLLDSTAALAAQRGSRLEFHLVGFAYRPLRTRPEARLTVHGEYAENDLSNLLESIDPDLAWFPALWPETYSYTLSAALNAGLPVVAPDLGAFPERLSGRAWTWICPWYRLSEEWVQFFEMLLARHFDPGIAPACAPVRSAKVAEFSYARDYLQGLRPPGLTATLPATFLEKYRRGRPIAESGR